MIFVTGGAGFIGSNFVRAWLAGGQEPVLNLDALTYAGSVEPLATLQGDARHTFVHGDICDASLVARLLAQHRPRAIVHFAAESHVDRSIDGPGAFVHTNVQGTLSLLEAARAYWLTLGEADRAAFRFLHISTDEVYGSLDPAEPPFTEDSRYAPNSPYSASKAAADHLVRAWHHTYRLPVLTTHCSNNYGPFQHHEKLIPRLIGNALAGKPLPLYGDGRNVRDWLHVQDHVAALHTVLARGVPGRTYNIGGECEKSNLEVARAVCALLDELAPAAAGSYERLIAFVPDRPGHDRRYAMDITKIRTELGWRPMETFASGLRKTVPWYLDRLRSRS
ncbi:dTDP-glucose 4,6-dehydratase [Schlegelella sp. S2-27]|uniref:dTDP-glucose 4,6-dehydratase n=1 Tax=Caldimonas mangrovi TaxID=2944811 RepID=A0ABT0YJW3_9BURK|nr:dTDP-glucose 4,6-dehydratase [Caldimonas mangrovi]MCM5679025.1 dTDP-glucose 4,6-dehydratase [Caldimonas mangrovi]